MRFECIIQRRQGHGTALFESVKECFKLSLIRVIFDVARVDRREREVAPLVLVESSELVGMESVVQEASGTAN